MRLIAAGILVLLAASAAAQEPRGCDKFAWPLDVEREALASAEKLTPSAGAMLDRNSQVAIAVQLMPFKDAKLSKPPERTPRNAQSFAGALSFVANSVSRQYRISLPEVGWIDVIQNDLYLKPVAFTGALDCPGIRKSVEFEIGVEPFILQLSDVSSPTISVVLTPVNP